jgi:ribosomal protein L20
MASAPNAVAANPQGVLSEALIKTHAHRQPRARKQPRKSLNAAAQSSTSISNLPPFPETAYRGVGGEFAELYSQHYEPPKEFFFMDFLAIVGTVTSGRFKVDFGGLNSQPRLFVLKVAKSAWRRKSFSTKTAKGFVERAAELAQSTEKKPKKSAKTHSWLRVINGAGSAEGLAAVFSKYVDQHGNPCAADHDEARFDGDRRVVLNFDEFRRFEKKARGENAVLAYMVNELYESNEYDNVTKTSSVVIDEAHLGFVSNTTETSYLDLLNAGEMVDLGFTNRLFIVASDTRKRKARPIEPDPTKVEELLNRLAEMLRQLPPLDAEGICRNEKVIPIDPEASKLWEDWYNDLPETEETARLDAIGMRLLGVLAFVSGKEVVDAELMQCVLDLLEYQRRIRQMFRPNLGLTLQAKLEQKILMQLEKHGSLSRRELHAYANAGREGAKVYEAALHALQAIGQIKKYIGPNGKTEMYRLVTNDEDEIGGSSSVKPLTAQAQSSRSLPATTH